MANKKILATILATIAASLCCVTPVLAVLAGTSTLATSFSWMEPYRDYLVALSILVLIYAWYDKLKSKSDIECACDEKPGFFSSKLFLAIVTMFVIVMLTFSQWGYSFFNIEPECETCVVELPVKEKKSCDDNKSCDTPSKCNDKNSSSLPVVACESGSSCSIPSNEKPKVKGDINSLPVLQYMDDEAKNPTDCNQVACSGTGFKELDELMAEARREVHEMSPAVLKKMLDNDEELILIDVREVIQRAEGEIYASDSYAIPRTNLEFEIMNIVKDKDAVIVLYSRQGARSLFAAQSLQKLGYTHVYNLSAGLKGWVRANYPFDNGLGQVVKVVDE